MVLVNRWALVVKPKQPFLDWVNSVESDSDPLTLEKLRNDPTIYLLPQCDTEKEFLAVVRKCSREIFAQELEAWYTDPDVWPRDLSFTIFRRWFDFEHHSMVVDLCQEPLIREE